MTLEEIRAALVGKYISYTLRKNKHLNGPQYWYGFEIFDIEEVEEAPEYDGFRVFGPHLDVHFPKDCCHRDRWELEELILFGECESNWHYHKLY